MSLAGLSSIPSNTSSNPTDFLTTRRQDASQLFSALENGDLAGAQSAYTQLAALSKSGSGGPYTGPKLTSDFAAIGQALQNGDLTGAQDAALQFGQDLIAANQKIRSREIASPVPPQSPSVVVNLSGSADAAASATSGSAATATALAPVASGSTSSSGTTGSGAAPEIVINLGGANGTPSIDLNIDGSQIEISLANAAGGNSPSAIDLNFGSAAAGSQIEINLANNNSSNSPQAFGINVVA